MPDWVLFIPFINHGFKWLVLRGKLQDLGTVTQPSPFPSREVAGTLSISLSVAPISFLLSSDLLCALGLFPNLLPARPLHLSRASPLPEGPRDTEGLVTTLVLRLRVRNTPGGTRPGLAALDQASVYGCRLQPRVTWSHQAGGWRESHPPLGCTLQAPRPRATVVSVLAGGERERERLRPLGPSHISGLLEGGFVTLPPAYCLKDEPHPPAYSEQCRQVPGRPSSAMGPKGPCASVPRDHSRRAADRQSEPGAWGPLGALCRGDPGKPMALMGTAPH